MYRNPNGLPVEESSKTMHQPLANMTFLKYARFGRSFSAIPSPRSRELFIMSNRVRSSSLCMFLIVAARLALWKKYCCGRNGTEGRVVSAYLASSFAPSTRSCLASIDNTSLSDRGWTITIIAIFVLLLCSTLHFLSTKDARTLIVYHINHAAMRLG